MVWLISANSDVYDHSSSFEHHGFIDWKQSNITYAINDYVYIYCSMPEQKIMYKCQIEITNLSFDKIRNDEEYWIKKEEYKKSLSGKFMRLKLIDQIDSEKLNLAALKNNGLKSPPQKPTKLVGGLLNYINENFTDDN
jgi:5-methylcytosine-specific restriction protein A